MFYMFIAKDFFDFILLIIIILYAYLELLVITCSNDFLSCLTPMLPPQVQILKTVWLRARKIRRSTILAFWNKVTNSSSCKLQSFFVNIFVSHTYVWFKLIFFCIIGSSSCLIWYLYLNLTKLLTIANYLWLFVIWMILCNDMDCNMIRSFILCILVA